MRRNSGAHSLGGGQGDLKRNVIFQVSRLELVRMHPIDSGSLSRREDQAHTFEECSQAPCVPGSPCFPKRFHGALVSSTQCGDRKSSQMRISTSVADAAQNGGLGIPEVAWVPCVDRPVKDVGAKEESQELDSAPGTASAALQT